MSSTDSSFPFCGTSDHEVFVRSDCMTAQRCARWFLHDVAQYRSASTRCSALHDMDEQRWFAKHRQFGIVQSTFRVRSCSCRPLRYPQRSSRSTHSSLPTLELGGGECQLQTSQQQTRRQRISQVSRCEGPSKVAGESAIKFIPSNSTFNSFSFETRHSKDHDFWELAPNFDDEDTIAIYCNRCNQPSALYCNRCNQPSALIATAAINPAHLCLNLGGGDVVRSHHMIYICHI